MIAIDFKNPADPLVTPIPFDFAAAGHDMVITDVHSDHADLTADYAVIRTEMQKAAEAFGKAHLREAARVASAPERAAEKKRRRLIGLHPCGV